MKYLVLFMESEKAWPIDMIGGRDKSVSQTRPQSEISRLLERTEPTARGRVNSEAIDGYTTIDVHSHDDAVRVANGWNWCGGVELLRLQAG